MIAPASGLGMRVGRFSKLLRELGVLAMPYARLDTTRFIGAVCRVPSGPGVRRLLVPSAADGEFIGHRSVVDGVDATR